MNGKEQLENLMKKENDTKPLVPRHNGKETGEGTETLKLVTFHASELSKGKQLITMNLISPNAKATKSFMDACVNFFQIRRAFDEVDNTNLVSSKDLRKNK